MTFDKYWVEVEKLRVLPQMAIKQLPSSLSMETKKRLLKLKPDVTVELLNTVIEQVNSGSVESIDSLVKKTVIENRC